VNKLAKGGFEIKDWKENRAGAKTGPKMTRTSGLAGKAEFSAPMGSKGKYRLTYEAPE
jgi:hypothetical protein